MTGRIVIATLNPAIDAVVLRGRDGAETPIARLPAGKGVNAARVLADLGRPCRVVGLMSAGERELFDGHLAALGVDAEWAVVPGPVRVNRTVLGPAPGEERHELGASLSASAGDLARVGVLIEREASRGAVVAFSGSLPAGVGAAWFGGVVAAAAERGAVVAVDTSGAALSAAITGPAHLIKVNAAELGAAVGRAIASTADAVDAARAAGAGQRGRTVIVTLGPAGAAMVDDAGTAAAGQVRVPPDQVRRATGAGDAFLAGVLDARLRGEGWEGALRAGLGAASASVISERPGHVGPDAVREMSRRAVIRRL
ncbi:MAG: hypothetical protein IBJ11_07770 [Phycisphaerales bacterium]|nr:hypothetical protein [Phycisphaerales bacterium]